MAGEKLARAIKGAKPHEDEFSDLIYGRVTSTQPLKIYVDNRFEITAPFITLSQMVRELNVTVTIDKKSGTATVFRNLQVGDRVKMLRVQKGQKYYVIERG